MTPLAVSEPSSVSDISSLIKFSNSLATPFTIAREAVVLNITNLNDFRNGLGILVADCDHDGEGGRRRWRGGEEESSGKKKEKDKKEKRL